MRRSLLSCCLLACLHLAFAGRLSAGDLDFGLPFDSPVFGEGTAGGDGVFGPNALSGLKLAEKPLLTATLIPESTVVAPGKPFKLLLNLEHRQGTYSYWLNPGGPGVATAIAWTLPPGFAISNPEWPTPQLHDNAGIISYVVKGKAALVFTVTPPANLEPGSEIPIVGDVNAQVCTARSCNPLRVEVKTAVSGGMEAGPCHPAVDKAVAALPCPPRSWNFDAAEEDGHLVITMRPGEGANPDLTGVYFYDHSAPALRVDSSLPQRLEKCDVGWRLRLPMLPGERQPKSTLSGELVAASGWLTGPDAPNAFHLELGVEGTGRPAVRRAAVEHPVFLLLLFAFLGGLLLNVMPCVFPVISLKIMGFAKQAHKDRSAVFLHGVCYAAGVLLCFWTLAFLVITMGRGWGTQLQSDWFMFALCHIFVIMSMNMAGAFEVGTSMAEAGQSLKRHEGLKRSFFTGLLATITSTPCSAPFLGTALAYALSLPPVLALGVFTLMGLGFALPYLLLSLFPNWLKKLPKPGAWMVTFRQAMCFPLFATTAYLFWTIEAMMNEWRFLMLLFGLVMTAMACWLYGKYQKSRPKSPRFAAALLTLGVFVLGMGVWIGVPKTDKQLEWGAWSPEKVAALRREGRPVYVDFTARWCATCQVNKRIYQDKELASLLADKNVALLKADWTLYDDRITSTLKGEFNKAAVPVTVLYVPGEHEATVLPDLLTVANVTEVLATIP